MDVKLLIDAIVRQTTALIAQLTIPSESFSEVLALAFDRGPGPVRLRLGAPGTCSSDPDGIVAAVPEVPDCAAR